MGIGPYQVPTVVVDAYGVHTNNPPCGAMPGFGAVQTCWTDRPVLLALDRNP
jgi:CO/xanthine dehydrogenase Mo-binding subunit